jgi:hypothetical protein
MGIIGDFMKFKWISWGFYLQTPKRFKESDFPSKSISSIQDDHGFLQSGCKTRHLKYRAVYCPANYGATWWDSRHLLPELGSLSMA